MQIQTKVISLLDGTNLTIQEADGSFDPKHAIQEANARKLEENLTKKFESDHEPYDKTLVYFAKSYYPALYACTAGESIPTLEQAYAMPPQDLDLWHKTVIDLNPDIFVIKPQPENIDPIEVIFRDESRVLVHATNDSPSYMMRLFRLETEVEDNPPLDSNEIYFQMMIYTKLAACSTGDVPTAAEAYRFPRPELTKWMNAAVEKNKSWFDPILQVGEKALREREKETVKKKRRGRKVSR